MSQTKTAFEQFMSKLAGDVAQAQAGARKASDVLRGTLETEIATTPFDIVYEEDRVKLKHYRSKAAIQSSRPL